MFKIVYNGYSGKKQPVSSEKMPAHVTSVNNKLIIQDIVNEEDKVRDKDVQSSSHRFLELNLDMVFLPVLFLGQKYLHFRPEKVLLCFPYLSSHILKEYTWSFLQVVELCLKILSSCYEA